MTDAASAGSVDVARPEPEGADTGPSAGARGETREPEREPVEDEAAVEEARPRPKKRKKKRKVVPDTRPAFARGFPRQPELDRLLDAFERGNYALVRAGAGRLAQDAEQDADVRRAARELLRRLDPDPLAVIMLLSAVGLLSFLALWYWLYGHGAP